VAGEVAARLAELGLTLPPAHPPVGTYVGWVITGSQIWVSGQGPVWGQEVRHTGTLGADLDLEQGREAARLTALNLLAQAAEALAGDLDRITRCLKIFGLVNADPGFTDAHRVIDGASDLIVDVLGPAGRHARAAVTAPALPMGIAVELDAVFEFA